MSIEDDARSGRSKEDVTDENIKKIHKIILNNCKVKMIEIVETLKISKERVGHIEHAKAVCKVVAASAHNRSKATTF
jgi:hypothetical protein